MYAIIKSGGKQRRVKKGEVIDVELLKDAKDGKVQFEDVYFVNDGSNALVGEPTVPGYVVLGEVLGEVKGPKIRSLKFKQRHHHNTRFGHRQHYSRVKIIDIVKK